MVTKGIKNMTKTRLEEIKQFAETNFSADENVQWSVPLVTPGGEEVAVTNIWIDRSARFPLTDTQAVEEWGLGNVVEFVNEAEKTLLGEQEESSTITPHYEKLFKIWFLFVLTVSILSTICMVIGLMKDIKILAYMPLLAFALITVASYIKEKKSYEPEP